MRLACFLGALLGSLALLTGCGSSSSRSVAATTPMNELAAGTIIDIGRVSLYLRCMGMGGPTIVFETGANGLSQNSWPVFEAASRIARACIYNRAGFAPSSPYDGYAGPGSERVTSSRDAAIDLHRLLAKAGVDGPYVFVAHSLGGWFAHSYLAEYPRQVKGVLLLDSVPPTTVSPPGVTDPFAANATVLVSVVRSGRSGLSARFQSRPLIVMVAARGSSSSWFQAQAEQARESSNSLYITALRSAHGIQFDQPKLVLATLRQLVETARKGGQLSCLAGYRSLGGSCRLG
jgi:hypothetical protein